MFERILTRARMIGQAAALTAIARLAREADLPRDVSIETDEKRVIISGRGLRRRLLDDPRLRRVGR